MENEKNAYLLLMIWRNNTHLICKWSAESPCVFWYVWNFNEGTEQKFFFFFKFNKWVFKKWVYKVILECKWLHPFLNILLENCVWIKVWKIFCEGKHMYVMFQSILVHTAPWNIAKLFWCLYIWLLCNVLNWYVLRTEPYSSEQVL